MRDAHVGVGLKNFELSSLGAICDIAGEPLEQGDRGSRMLVVDEVGANRHADSEVGLPGLGSQPFPELGNDRADDVSEWIRVLRPRQEALHFQRKAILEENVILIFRLVEELKELIDARREV